MRFIINKTITFNVPEKTLSNNVKTIRLPNPASRLLLILIENKSKQVGREELLTRIWEDHGLNASGNSLTNNISILRRSLSELGMDGIIETVPKQGVTLKTEDIELKNLSDEGAEGSTLVITPLMTKWRKRAVMVLSVASVLFFITLLLRIFLTDRTVWVPYKIIDHCQIVYPEEVSQSKVEAFFHSQPGMEFTRTCSQGTIIFYDDAKVDPKNGITDVFLAVCRLNKEGELDECQNYVEVAVK